jgi:hypothetical protein
MSTTSREVSYGRFRGGFPSISVRDGGGGRRPMMIICQLCAFDAFRALAMAYPMTPLAPVKIQTLLDVISSGAFEIMFAVAAVAAEGGQGGFCHAEISDLGLGLVERLPAIFHAS